MEELRAEFPVFERTAYMNAGTNGPVARRSAAAAAAEVREQADAGRGGRPFFEKVVASAAELRGRVARLVNADASEIALTGSTTDGVNAVLTSLDFAPGDEVLTSDEEHPGITAPLAGIRRRYGVRVREVPFESLAGEVDPTTKLVACSHVSWMTGRVADSEDIVASGVPVLLDGAQGLGAVPVDVKALGCDFYAASGQKWMCGPQGSGYLYVRADRAAELPPPWPGYPTLGEDGEPHPDARRFDLSLPPSQNTAWALAALDVLEEPGIETVYEYAADLAERLAERLAGADRRVAPRGRSTLVSWEDADPAATVERAREHGVIVRNLPGTPYIRASVGGWTSEDDLDRLLEAAL
jgi:L-cysteine/cystine lyase